MLLLFVLCLFREFVFHCGDFCQPADVSFLGAEDSSKEGPNQLSRQLGANHAGAQDKYVHVIVLYSLMRGIGIVTESGTDASDLVGSYGCTDTAAADDDSPISEAVAHGDSDGLGKIRVVNGLGRMRAHIEDVCPKKRQPADCLTLQFESGVI